MSVNFRALNCNSDVAARGLPLGYSKNLSLISWDILSESKWLLLLTAAMLFRLIAVMITVLVTIRYSPYLKVFPVLWRVLQTTVLYLVAAFLFAYAARRTGLLMDDYDSPSVSCRF